MPSSVASSVTDLVSPLPHTSRSSPEPSPSPSILTSPEPSPTPSQRSPQLDKPPAKRRKRRTKEEIARGKVLKEAKKLQKQQEKDAEKERKRRKKEAEDRAKKERKRKVVVPLPEEWQRKVQLSGASLKTLLERGRQESPLEVDTHVDTKLQIKDFLASPLDATLLKDGLIPDHNVLLARLVEDSPLPLCSVAEQVRSLLFPTKKEEAYLNALKASIPRTSERKQYGCRKLKVELQNEDVQPDALWRWECDASLLPKTCQRRVGFRRRTRKARKTLLYHLERFIAEADKGWTTSAELSLKKKWEQVDKCTLSETTAVTKEEQFLERQKVKRAKEMERERAKKAKESAKEEAKAAKSAEKAGVSKEVEKLPKKDKTQRSLLTMNFKIQEAIAPLEASKSSDLPRGYRERFGNRYEKSRPANTVMAPICRGSSSVWLESIRSKTNCVDASLPTPIPRRKRSPRQSKRRKFLMFQTNRRPPFWGWSSLVSSVVHRRRPFDKDPNLAYEIDSGNDWSDEPEDAEDLENSGVDDDDIDGDMKADRADGLAQDDFLVPEDEDLDAYGAPSTDNTVKGTDFKAVCVGPYFALPGIADDEIPSQFKELRTLYRKQILIPGPIKCWTSTLTTPATLSSPRPSPSQKPKNTKKNGTTAASEMGGVPGASVPATTAVLVPPVRRKIVPSTVVPVEAPMAVPAAAAGASSVSVCPISVVPTSTTSELLPVPTVNAADETSSAKAWKSARGSTPDSSSIKSNLLSQLQAVG